MKVTFTNTTNDDAEALVKIRIKAMREGLERIGRFDPQRARDRFLTSFNPDLCKYIQVDGEKVGFILLRPMDDHLLLDHLYITPEQQGRGIGAVVLGAVLADADSRNVSVKLGALRGSDANRFYQRHGFVKTEEAEWDIYYIRVPVKDPR